MAEDGGTEDGDVGVLLGHGAGGFAAAVTFASSGFPSSVAVADFNADGYTWTAVDGSIAIAADGVWYKGAGRKGDLRSAVSAGSETRAEPMTRAEPRGQRPAPSR